MSMETVYVDSLFTLNFIIDYLLLLCTAKVSGVSYRRRRYAAAAALGAAYAVAAVLPAAAWLGSAPMKLALGGGMALIAYGGERRFFRCAVTFLAVSAAFGGAVWAAGMLAGGSGGGAYVPVSSRVLALSFAVSYAAVSLVYRRSGQRAERQLVTLTVSFGGRSVALRALRDTGNGLYDPISGKSVAVAEGTALLPLLPEGAAAALAVPDAAAQLTALRALPGCAGRFRLIPYSAVGTGSALLTAFRPDSADVDGADTDALLAISPNRLSHTGEHEAII